MPSPAQRAVKFVPKPGIKDSFREFKQAYPEIADSMKTFNEYKREIPPKRLPAAMKDHHLKGSLDGLRECHLAPDVLLFYTHENDVITLIMIGQHSDMNVKKSRIIKNKAN